MAGIWAHRLIRLKILNRGATVPIDWKWKEYLPGTRFLHLPFHRSINADYQGGCILFAVSKADALCLADLLFVDLSVFGWLLNPHIFNNAPSRLPTARSRLWL